jgi:hypothetical protein
MKRDALGWVVATVAITLLFLFPVTRAVTSILIEGGRSVRPALTPGDSSGVDYCWRQYHELKALHDRAAARADSLQRLEWRLRVRIAELEHD